MMEKIFIAIIDMVILFILFVVGLIMTTSPVPGPTKDELIELFNENKPLFVNIARELKTIKGDVSFDIRDGQNIDSIGEIDTKEGVVKAYKIPNSIKSDVKKIIYENDFIDIYEDSNCIYFDSAVDFHWHKALVYSEDGQKPPQLKVQEFEEIGNGWYYYVGE